MFAPDPADELNTGSIGELYIAQYYIHLLPAELFQSFRSTACFGHFKPFELYDPRKQPAELLFIVYDQYGVHGVAAANVEE
jgi:hypothetical protein